jgi:hypothetical protein
MCWLFAVPVTAVSLVKLIQCISGFQGGPPRDEIGRGLEMIGKQHPVQMIQLVLEYPR